MKEEIHLNKFIKSGKHKNIRWTIEKDKDGYYAIAGLQGIYSQGKTLAEAKKNIKDAIDLILLKQK